MVKVRFKTSEKRKKAWQIAGKSDFFKSGGLKGAHWVGEKTLTFPNTNKVTLKRFKIIN